MSISFNTPIQSIGPIGKAIASRLKKLDLKTAEDLFWHFPFRYDDYSNLKNIDKLVGGEIVTIKGKIELIRNKRSKIKHTIITEAMIADETGSIKAVWFNQPFLTKNLRGGDEIYLSGKVDFDYYGLQFSSPEYEKVRFGETITTARLVPVYPLTSNVTQKQIRFLIKQILKLTDKVDDWLPQKVKDNLGLIHISAALCQIHFPKDKPSLESARKRLKFDELFFIQLQSQSIKLEIEQNKAQAVKFKKQATKEFVDSLPFVLTNDQKKSAWEILQDIEKDRPMNRLLEGNVGSGKTVVAAMALLNVFLNKFQAVFMAPTEILAVQHFKSIVNLFQQNFNTQLIFQPTLQPPLSGGLQPPPDKGGKGGWAGKEINLKSSKYAISNTADDNIKIALLTRNNSLVYCLKLTEQNATSPLIRGTGGVGSQNNQTKQLHQPYIPYNLDLTKKAQNNRKNSTKAEKKIWEVLKRKQFENYKFIRQKPLDNFIVDFYCSQLMLVIEIDGGSHGEKTEYDTQRTKILEQYGLQVIRYNDEEIMNGIDGVYQDLSQKIIDRKKELNSINIKPPIPSCQGDYENFPPDKGGKGGLPGNEEKLTKAKLIKMIENGEIDIIIGTHALIQEKVNFKNLALAIIDEQHRFGVEQRHTLNRKDGLTKTMPHFLSMTATPIPRSLSLALYGDLDLSIIKEMPKNRKAVITKVVSAENREKAYQFISGQVKQGRQIFVVCPLIDPSDKLGYKSVSSEYEKLNKNIFPDLIIGLLHGRLKKEEKEKVMQDFLDNKINILVSTSVIEVGIDIPNAVIMMIEGAERFGLAQLHQFRGRVGRSNHQSYCLLFAELNGQKIQERLNCLVCCNDGFELAERDLQLRGPGEVYGTRQSGMPELKIASFSDVEIIKLAKSEAQGIIREIDEHPLLKKKLEEYNRGVHLE